MDRKCMPAPSLKVPSPTLAFRPTVCSRRQPFLKHHVDVLETSWFEVSIAWQRVFAILRIFVVKGGIVCCKDWSFQSVGCRGCSCTGDRSVEIKCNRERPQGRVRSGREIGCLVSMLIYKYVCVIRFIYCILWHSGGPNCTQSYSWPVAKEE